MIKNTNYKKLMLCSIITLLATNCGGGGGGGGGPTNVRQPIAIQKEPIRLNYNNDNKIENIPIINANNNYNAANINENKFDKIDIPKPFNSPDKITIQPNGSYKYSYIQNEVSNNDDFQNKRMTVAIMDSDFLTKKEELKKTYHDILILDKVSQNPSPNKSLHGERVLSILNENQNFKIVAASIGEKRNDRTFVVPSLELYKKTFENLKNEKVKIINQSWGLDLNTSIIGMENYQKNISPPMLVREDQNEIIERAIDSVNRGNEYIKFYKEKVADGGLFIWANGNYGSNERELVESSIQAQLPARNSELEKGWISVIGINPKEYKYLADRKGGYIANKHYSKHLAWPGTSANWAISANAEGLENANNTLGSSYAAPRVARAAALVAKKYDWMTNSQIRETLFTTTDTPELEYDSSGKLISNREVRYKLYEADGKYGWGVLNTERALKGPGGFIKNILKADSNNYYKDANYSLCFMANLPKIV